MVISLAAYYWNATSLAPILRDAVGDDLTWRAAQNFHSESIAWRAISTKFDLNKTVYNSKAEVPYILDEDEERSIYLGFENQRSILAKVCLSLVGLQEQKGNFCF